MHMPILMKADVAGQTQAGYQAVFEALAPLYRTFPGFIAHLSHPTENGWCVMDVWESREHCEAFFRQHVVPQLQDSLRPKISFQPLHDALAMPVSIGAAAAAG
jgi:heme-degrading monooxygenase HmoA